MQITAGTWPLRVVSFPVALWWWCVLPHSPLGCGLKTTFFDPSVLLGCRGPRPPRPTSMSPPPRLPLLVSLTRLLPVLLNFPVGLTFGVPPWLLVNARIRGSVGTQAPQSRAVNLLSEETMALPDCPTWHHVIRHTQCTEVTLSCSCSNQRTRVLI